MYRKGDITDHVTFFNIYRFHAVTNLTLKPNEDH